MIAGTRLPWLLRHELRLAWRDWLSMITAGRPARLWMVALSLAGFALLMHLPAYAVVGRFAALGSAADPAVRMIAGVSILLAFALILSQAMEAVTRVFYARADLDLLMSSPLDLAGLFSIRMAAIAGVVTVMALLLAAPFIDVLVLGGGARWLAAYGLVAAVAAAAAACAMALTVTLFRLIGPRRTRLVAQILAAVIGAGFVIALQIAAILSAGTLSRFAVVTSDTMLALAPAAGHPLWLPVQALFGDATALLLCAATSLVLLGLVMARLSPRLGDDISRAAAVSAVQAALPLQRFPRLSRRQALRWKELRLLRRDPWLLSQSLMQLLYLVPPAVMLWHSFGSGEGGGVALGAPVLVMAAGQLAGGLAWLTISGEDAPDLVATAPLPPAMVMQAKIEAVGLVIAAIFGPFVLGLAWLAPAVAAVVTLGIAAAALSATAIQLWFRSQARRSQFRRRQTSSKLATFAEAFCSIGWAATTALALPLPLVATVTALLTGALLLAVWRLSPRR
jgi:ABC-2 type transport system permease protein